MISFKRIQEEDICEVRRLALKSWRFAYKGIYNEKTIKKNVSDYYADKRFFKDLRDIKSGKCEFILAVESGKIIGYAQVCKLKSGWDVLRIYVDPKQLRRGIGSRLLRRIETFLKKKHVKQYTIYPHVKNKIATNFYKKSGFKRAPRRDRGWNSPCYIKQL
ncbi:GNAT family N-acetyltransferase [archaeon]|nr:GNAT family N-acetyltransferase [archaeon]